MNREKEILLALLLEKYGEPKVFTVPDAQSDRSRGRRTKSARSSTMWTEAELKAMVRLVNLGCSFVEIAKQLSRTEMGVYAMFLQVNSPHVASKNPTVLNHRIQNDPELMIKR